MEIEVKIMLPKHALQNYYSENGVFFNFGFA